MCTLNEFPWNCSLVDIAGFTSIMVMLGVMVVMVAYSIGDYLRK